MRGSRPVTYKPQMCAWYRLSVEVVLTRALQNCGSAQTKSDLGALSEGCKTMTTECQSFLVSVRAQTMTIITTQSFLTLLYDQFIFWTLLVVASN